MGVIRAQVEFDMATALPADKIVNTFHFNALDGAGYPTTAQLDEIDAALSDFYLTVGATGGQALRTMMSEACATTWRIKTYDLSQPKPRIPLRTTEKTNAPGGGDTLPNEVALCLSFRAANVPGVPGARRRGRIYFGPNQIANTSTTAPGRPVQSLINTLRDAALRLATRPAADPYWGVYSRANLPNPVAASVIPEVVAGWVDNAWDTQRRRGPASTARTTF
jgi:hypothetical protein